MEGDCNVYAHSSLWLRPTGEWSINAKMVYTTKIMESVCVYVCMYVAYVCMSGYAFRHALRYRAETLHGGRGRAHEVCGHIFEAAPPGVKGHPGVNLP